MRTMLGAALCLVSLAAQGGADPQSAVAALDRELNALITAGAPAAAASYYADDFVLTTSSGARRSKAELVRQIGARDLTLEVNETRDVQVRVLDDTAVLTAILHQKGTLDGAAFDAQMWVTDTWVRGGEHGWRLLAGQATRIPAQST